MLAWIGIIVFVAIFGGLVYVLAWEAVERLKNHNRYFLVVEYRDNMQLYVFAKRDKWRDAWEYEHAKAKIDKQCLRVVQFELNQLGFIQAGFSFSRIGDGVSPQENGGLTGEAKILTFPRRKAT
jgi:hypothetical protein